MKTIKIQQFKVRCSGLNDITTNGRSSGSMGETCKSYVKQWLIEQITGVRKEISSKEMEKGIWCEDEAIQLAGKHFGWFMPEKNTERRCNDWLTGECDVVLPNSIEDIKCPYDVQTFPNFSREIPVKGYEKQLQGYMELWEKPSAGLVYVLVETPEDIDLYGTCAQPVCGYSTWELSERIRRYETERDKQFIALARERVEDCRVYISKELVPELEEWKKIKIEIAS